MSDLYIMVNRDNADRNSLADLCAAVTEAGGTILNVDEQNHMIEAAAPSSEISTIAAMEGVSYVRSIFNYLSDAPPRSAA
ncbi:MAG TPA: hypothetical protein VFC78_01915 [Tepidisphaeraceae bacterium]|nr:hypothetical protein [Tepidisphaeraceae bacterium]